jgi:flagellin-like protein
MEKRGVSGIITMVILIALTLVVIGIVWIVINNLVEEQIENTESCFGIQDKVKINDLYTCWNSNSSELRFSIGVEDIEPNEILISIASVGETSSFRINNTVTNITNVVNYPSRTEGIKIPGKNSGLTYIHTGFTTKPDQIEVAPVLNGEQCGITDSMREIEVCY